MVCTTTESCATALTLNPIPCTWIPRLRPERKYPFTSPASLAHWFKNVIQDNILFGMDEITVDGFFEQYKDLLDGTIPYGFPACCGIEELRERMDREHIRVFVIDSSLGLCGFVLAKEVELQCQSLLIK